MLDFTSMPASEGKEIKEVRSFDEEVVFTYKEVVSEESLYKELNNRLKKLEVATDSNIQELNLVKEKANEFNISIDEKEVIMLRCDWLERLYEVEAALGNIENKEAALKLQRSLQIVQSSPFKKKLLEKLSSIEKMVASKKEESFEQELMNEAIKGNKFLFSNLGVTGRDHVISKAIEKYEDQIELQHLISLATELEEKVNALSNMSDMKELKAKLTELPLPQYLSLTEAEQREFADILINSNDWSNLVELQRKLSRFQKDAMLSKELLDNNFNTSKGEATHTINIEDGIPNFLSSDEEK